MGGGGITSYHGRSENDKVFTRFDEMEPLFPGPGDLYATGETAGDRAGFAFINPEPRDQELRDRIKQLLARHRELEDQCYAYEKAANPNAPDWDENIAKAFFALLFKNLKLQDLFSCMLVSKRFNTAVTHYIKSPNGLVKFDVDAARLASTGGSCRINDTAAPI